MSIRVGFVLGKEFDFVDAPGSPVDTSFLADLPQEYRKRAEKPRQFWPGMSNENKDYISTDLAIAWYIHKHCTDLEVDFIFPQDITLERLKLNTCNFVVGYDLMDGWMEGEEQYAKVKNAFQNCGNISPSFECQEAINYKSRYLQAAIDAGVPVAPTIFAQKESRHPDALLQQIKARGWKTFLMKQSYSCGSMGVKKLQVKDCEGQPEILEEYFSTWSECPEFIIQEFIEGFCRNWEVKCYWFNGEFLFAMGHRATVSLADGEKASMVLEEDLPEGFLQQAKDVGQQSLKALPQLTAPNGSPIGMTLIRTDIGISDSQLHDKDFAHWDGSSKMFFLNELECSATTYFPRALKYDSMPLWADLWASKAREIAQKMEITALKPMDAKKEADFRSASIETCLISDTASVSSDKGSDHALDKSSDSE